MLFIHPDLLARIITGTVCIHMFRVIAKWTCIKAQVRKICADAVDDLSNALKEILQ